MTSLLEGRISIDKECQLSSLPVKFDGMSITNLASISDIEYQKDYEKITGQNLK